jgi:hypothetical protein
MQAEAQLCRVMYEKAHPEANVAAGPAQAVYERLRQPFEEVQVCFAS